ncbi:flagellar basal-body rod protein FlgF [Herbaspirillum rubrisubalbicans]|uniref:flagellar hook protein FlgE n=1 Tax=Herbaspirillum rubrisubalbicans TaxID=80842 RepID=UPI000DC21603|nr:flagellar hook-basal body complex protein [Herbaspirillum rubrisubalbicans]RAN48425.1 flagellar basal-body rod protein FlgF [Herbaspirillum rubrisubalbicans]
MIDSIYIATSGLQGFETGLQNISGNTTNLNTPGFKESTTQFADLFYKGGLSDGSQPNAGQVGVGLQTLGTKINFAQGQFQSTSNNLDLAVDGRGYFVLKGSDGNIHYTRDGEFQFDSSGNLVSSTNGQAVMALDSSGNLQPITLNTLTTGPAKTTTTVTFTGNLSSTATSDSINNVTVIDGNGTSHKLSLSFVPVSGSPGNWSVTVKDGATTVGTGNIAFSSGQPVSGSTTISLTYSPSGAAAMPLTLDFSNNVTSFDSGTSSTLAVNSQDGHASGALLSETFDTSGTLQLKYSNGQTVKTQQLALAQFSSQDDAKQVSSNEFDAVQGHTWLLGVAGANGFGNIQAGEVEMSNVDLSQQFSTLVIMQRGYQASSQIITTANDMMTQLFGMVGK